MRDEGVDGGEVVAVGWGRGGWEEGRRRRGEGLIFGGGGGEGGGFHFFLEGGLGFVFG